MNQVAASPRVTRLFNTLQHFNERRVLYAIRNGFIAVMPLMILGALSTVYTSLPVPGYQGFMLRTFGENWRLPGELVYYGTTQVMAVLVVITIGLNLGAWHNKGRSIHVREGICAIVALASYILMCVPLDGSDAFPFADTSVNGMFLGMITAVLATEIFVAVLTLSGQRFFVSNDPNFAVPQSFNAVGPAALTLGIFVVVRLVFVLLGYRESVGTLIYSVLSMPFQNLGDGVLSATVFMLATHVMWLFGIHGNNVLDGVATEMFVANGAENVEMVAAGLAAPNLVTKTSFDVFVFIGGAGCTLGLLLAMTVFGNRKSYKQMFQYAYPTAVFNINEPLIFGVPVVLNPVFAIPFVLVPVVLLGTTTLAMWLGLVPYTVADVSWTTPAIFSGYVATGSWVGAALQVVNLAIATLIYAPFVRLNEKMLEMRFADSYKTMQDFIFNEYDPSVHRLLTRVDEIGAVARKLSGQLRSGMKDGSMYLVYQPIVDGRTNTLHSVEALLRWNTKTNGHINPMVTVALAEETHRMGELGLWIMEEALRQRHEWNLAGLPDFHVSVNVSTHQLEDPDFHEKVAALMRKHTVPPQQLQVEITETAALFNSEATRVNLQKLADMGITLAMDDFGVGHSSLLYLRTQPITTLKIDAAISRDIVENPHSLQILITIRDLCKTLEVETIVEHVDNQTQLELLLECDAYLIQGYYFSPPLLNEEFVLFLEKLKTQRKTPLQR